MKTPIDAGDAVMEENENGKKNKRQYKTSRIAIILFVLADTLIVCLTALLISGEAVRTGNCWLFYYKGQTWFDHAISTDDGTEFPAGTKFDVIYIRSDGVFEFREPETDACFSSGYKITDAANGDELQKELKQMQKQEAMTGYKTQAIITGICFLVAFTAFWLLDHEFGIPGNIVTLVVTILIFWGIGILARAYLSRAKAPVIYLYPQTRTEVNVRLSLKGNLTSTFPAYDKARGWTVTASPDGTLTDKNGNKYPFLYWEAGLVMKPDLRYGYCVKGEDTKEFLDMALKQLGLSDAEAGDFTGYWLPQMEGNRYNVITFQTTAYEKAASMNISPKPDTVIRVNMLWYSSDSFVDIKPQDLTSLNPRERKGFTVVEWGGEEI